jgi:hypothetical protein
MPGGPHIVHVSTIWLKIIPPTKLGMKKCHVVHFIPSDMFWCDIIWCVIVLYYFDIFRYLFFYMLLRSILFVEFFWFWVKWFCNIWFYIASLWYVMIVMQISPSPRGYFCFLIVPCQFLASGIMGVSCSYLQMPRGCLAAICTQRTGYTGPHP